MVRIQHPCHVPWDGVHSLSKNVAHLKLNIFTITLGELKSISSNEMEACQGRRRPQLEIQSQALFRLGSHVIFAPRRFLCHAGGAISRAPSNRSRCVRSAWRILQLPMIRNWNALQAFTREAFEDRVLPVATPSANIDESSSRGVLRSKAWIADWHPD